MTFDILAFIKTNRVVFTWLTFFGLLLFIMERGLFGLVFVTFFLTYIFRNIVERMRRRVHIGQRPLTMLLYLVFVTLVLTLVSFMIPKLGAESTTFLRQLPLSIAKIKLYLDSLSADQPNFAHAFEKLKEAMSMESLLGLNVEALARITMQSFNQVTHYVSNFLLGTLFSFLILYDYPNLKRKVRSLRRTRARGIYDEVSEFTVNFGAMVGAAFQAQIMIAGANTALTAIGLWILGIEPISLLSTIVFVCGLIPVLGTFLSSVPIMLLAINIGGFKLMTFALGMIMLVHFFENYIINPRIFGHVFKSTTLFTLIILYIAFNVFGLWGVVLGVPVTMFFYRHIIVGQTTLKPEVSDPPLDDSETPGSA